MGNELNGLRVAILVTDGFEQVELTVPREALHRLGAATDLISPDPGEVQGYHHDEKGDKFPVDVTLDLVKAAQYGALLLPGGVANPDRLRTIPGAVQFTNDFVLQDKPIAAICHGPWLLVESGIVRGRTLTSWPSLKTDVRNAGGIWVDQDVVVDHGLVTSRKPDDLPAFTEKMIEVFRTAMLRRNTVQRELEARAR
ncbi:MAG TPA: type 1 glutamine amidotransferase domain-containing protein [Bryobacteraceae bacterium]|nr:type 1 glutamine amidotransferase domain-containing protein [Bryobacteraceae bacterium]